MRGKSYLKGWLTAEWSKKESDVIYNYPCKPDGYLLHNSLRDLLAELERRDYDIKTLKFSIKRKSAA